MIKDSNTRVQITMTKKQLDWVKKMAKKLNITVSQTISFFLVKKAEELYQMQKLETNKEQSQELLEEMIRIAKTPWLDVNE